MKELRTMVNEDEKILWEGRPNRKAFFANRVLGEIWLPAVWLYFSVLILETYMSLKLPLFRPSYIFLVFALWNLPVWLWLYRVCVTSIAQKHTYYILTDKNLYLKNGRNELEVFFTKNDAIPYMNVVKEKLHIGLVVDRAFNVGDIHFKATVDGKKKRFYITDIDDIKNVYKIFKEQLATETVSEGV